MPILDLQLRLRQLGTLRMGELVTKNGKTFPSTRDTWRVTTSDEKIAAAIAERFGGTVSEWDSKSAERLVVDTDTKALPVAVVPGHAISQWYELWAGGGCKRRCDGVDEAVSGGACLCDPESDQGRECKPTTRLSLVVRGIEALGLFRLNTGGWYAAQELGGAVQFLEQVTARGESMDGWLRIEERRVVRDGQTKVFKVPVLDVAFGMERLLPSADQTPALPPGYTPVAELPAGPSLADGLAATEGQVAHRTTRSAAPIPNGDDIQFGESPVPIADGIPPAPAERPPSPNVLLTQAQKKKLNVLVGTLRDTEKITTEQLYVALAKERNLRVDDMVAVIEGAKDDKGLHWAALRDTLSRLEASELIDRLTNLEERVAKEAAQKEATA